VGNFVHPAFLRDYLDKIFLKQRLVVSCNSGQNMAHKLHSIISSKMLPPVKMTADLENEGPFSYGAEQHQLQ
jgi:hypothetical protein